MKKLTCIYAISMLLLSVFTFSCTTNDVDEMILGGEIVQIKDEAFGEYLFYRKAAGVTQVKETVGGDVVYTYFVNTELAKKQISLDLNKMNSTLTTLEADGLHTAKTKIKEVSELQYFINLTNIRLTSNEITEIDLSKMTNLETLDLNNNWINQLDLTQNVKLVTLTYNASTNASVSNDLKLKTIDLSKNTKLTSVSLKSHPGTPFPIPAVIYDKLTTKDGVVSEDDYVDPNKVLILDEALGEYLTYLNVAGVTEENKNGIYKYYINPELAKNQTAALSMSKAGTSITALTNAGVRTAATKIKNATELQYFINITGLTLTSNEVESIDLTKLTKLQTLNLNNNFIGSLDLTKNVDLTSLSYTASTKAGVQKLTAIDLSKNVNLTSIDLTGHTGAPFAIPAAIFNQLTTKKGVVSQ